VNFQEIEALQVNGQWDEAGKLLAASAKQIECAGADFLVICTNTMHKVCDAIAAQITIPILHITDATAESIKAKSISRVGLLGTQFTM